MRRVCGPVKEMWKMIVSGGGREERVCVSVYKPRRWRLRSCDPSWSEIAAHDRGQNDVLVYTGRMKGHTDLPGPFKLDDFVSVLIDVNLFLRIVTPVLDDDEQ